MKPPTIDIINFCNFSCGHCLVNKSAEHHHMDPHMFADLITQLRGLGYRYAGITGTGEISLHPELEAIFLTCVENNFNFEILTNGFLFKEKLFPLFQHPMIRKRVARVGFSLDSANQAVHDSNRKKGSFQRVVEATGLCRLLGIPFYIKTAVNNLNRNELKDIILFTSSLGASLQTFIFPQPTMRAMDEDIVPEPREIYKAFKEMVHWYNIFPRIKLEAFNPFNDLFMCNAFFKFGVDEEGNYLLCNNLCNVGLSNKNYKGKECIGKIGESSLKDLIVRHIHILPEILEWRLKRKEAIKNAPLSICNWCFHQFGKLDWLEKYPDSPWTQCLASTSTD